MKKVRAIFLMSPELSELAKSFAVSAGLDMMFTNVNSLKEIEHLVITKSFDLLLSFGTGVIVPPVVLKMPGLSAFNIHAGSPDYHGRDPHHFAIYREAKTYGATLHRMTDKVDEGQILDVELFDVPSQISASELLARANLAGIKLMHRFFLAYAGSKSLSPRCELKWGLLKSKRSDFLEMCRVDCSMSKEEFFRRMRATEMPEFNNLYLDLHGYRFRLEGKIE